jgi:hypothetical protein
MAPGDTPGFKGEITYESAQTITGLIFLITDD